MAPKQGLIWLQRFCLRTGQLLKVVVSLDRRITRRGPQSDLGGPTTATVDPGSQNLQRLR